MTENSGVVFVGRKPAMSYVLAIITSLSSSNARDHLESTRTSNHHSC